MREITKKVTKPLRKIIVVGENGIWENCRKEKTLKIESQSAHNNNEETNELGAYILWVQKTLLHYYNKYKIVNVITIHLDVVPFGLLLHPFRSSPVKDKTHKESFA